MACVLASAAAADDGWTLRQLRCLEVKAAGDLPAPIIDGTITDLEWARVDPTAAEGEFGTGLEFRLLSKDDALYVAAEVRAEKPDIRTDARSRDDEAALEDDGVELVLDGGPSLTRGLRVIVTSGNKVWDEQLLDGGPTSVPGYDAKVTSATAPTTSGWAAELRIPWSELGLAGVKGEMLGFNIASRVRGERQVALVDAEKPTDLCGLAVAGVDERLARNGELRLAFKELSCDGGKGTLYVDAHNSLNETEQFLIRYSAVTQGADPQGGQLRMLIEDHETAHLGLGPVPLGDTGCVLFTISPYTTNNTRAPRSLGFTAVLAVPEPRPAEPRA